MLLPRDAEVTLPAAPSPAHLGSSLQFGVFPEQASHLNRRDGCVGKPRLFTLRRDRQWQDCFSAVCTQCAHRGLSAPDAISCASRLWSDS